MVNPYRGEASIEINGRTYVVWFGWPGVAMLREQIGDDVFDGRLTVAMSQYDLPVLAKALAIGLRDSWPGVTAEEIERLSPPLAVVVDALSVGIMRTFYGKEAPAEPPANPPQGRLRRLLARMWFSKRSRPASSPA